MDFVTAFDENLSLLTHNVQHVLYAKKYFLRGYALLSLSTWAIYCPDDNFYTKRLETMEGYVRSFRKISLNYNEILMSNSTELYSIYLS